LYLADQLAVKTAALDAANVWMKNRAADLNDKVLAQQAAMARYRAGHGLTQGVQARIGTEEMSTLGEELMRAENDLAGAEARQSVVAAGVSSAGVAQNVVSMRLAEAQVAAALDAARTRLGPNHPQVRALREERATLLAAAGAEVSAVHAGVAGDASAAAARLAHLRQNLALLKAEGAAQAEAEGPLAAMEQDAEATRKLLQSLLAQMDQTAQQAAIQTPDARILSRAEPPVTPSSPKVRLLLAAALLAGAAIGGGIAWAREAARLTLRTESEVREALGLPVLGAVPRVRGRDPVAIALAAEGGAPGRQVDSLRARLRALLGDPGLLVITSSRPGEGKSTLALALGRRAAAHGERVLLIDCDRARPNLSRLLGAEAAAGLAELCATEDADATPLLRTEAGSGLVFLPAGDGRQRFSLEALPGLLARQGWRRDFGLIILDAPPVVASADALTLGDMADATLFCLRWRHTPRRLAVYARSLLKQGGSRGMAVALTQLDPGSRALRGFPEAEIGRRRYAAYTAYARR
jgi:Mrp family chromosome partitioning ATPase